MKLRAIAISLFAMCLGGASAQDSYVAEIQRWQSEQEKELRSDNGWLTVSGLFWLHPGNNTFGSGKTNEIVLPAPVPEKAGWFTLENGMVIIFAIADLDVRLNGHPVTSRIVGGVVMKQATLPADKGGGAGT